MCSVVRLGKVENMYNMIESQVEKELTFLEALENF